MRTVGLLINGKVSQKKEADAKTQTKMKATKPEAGKGGTETTPKAPNAETAKETESTADAKATKPEAGKAE